MLRLRSYHFSRMRWFMTRIVFLSFLVTAAASSVAWGDGSYNIKIEAPAGQKAHKGVAKIHITPGAGFHVNKEYPATAKVVAPQGVTLDKDKVPPSKVEETAMDFEVAYTPSEAGKKTFTGELKFAVCSA